MSDPRPMRMTLGELTDDFTQLTRRTERLAAQFADFHRDVAAGREFIADHARRLATDALEIAMQAARVESLRRSVTYLEHATNAETPTLTRDPAT